MNLCRHMLFAVKTFRFMQKCQKFFYYAISNSILSHLVFFWPVSPIRMKLCRHMLFSVKTFILMRECQKYTTIILLVTQFYPSLLISGQFHPKRWNYADICCLVWRYSDLYKNVRNIWIYVGCPNRSDVSSLSQVSMNLQLWLSTHFKA